MAPMHAFDHSPLELSSIEYIFEPLESAVNFGPSHLRIESQDAGISERVSQPLGHAAAI